MHTHTHGSANQNWLSLRLPLAACTNNDKVYLPTLATTTEQQQFSPSHTHVAHFSLRFLLLLRSLRESGRRARRSKNGNEERARKFVLSLSLSLSAQEGRKVERGEQLLYGQDSQVWWQKLISAAGFLSLLIAPREREGQQ